MESLLQLVGCSDADSEPLQLQLQEQDPSLPLLGMSFDPKRGRWKARIHFAGAERYIGRYETSTEAALAYDQAARVINNLTMGAAVTDPSKKRSRQLNFPDRCPNNPAVTSRMQAIVANALSASEYSYSVFDVSAIGAAGPGGAFGDATGSACTAAHTSSPAQSQDSAAVLSAPCSAFLPPAAAACASPEQGCSSAGGADGQQAASPQAVWGAGQLWSSRGSCCSLVGGPAASNAAAAPSTGTEHAAAAGRSCENHTWVLAARRQRKRPAAAGELAPRKAAALMPSDWQPADDAAVWGAQPAINTAAELPDTATAQWGPPPAGWGAVPHQHQQQQQQQQIGNAAAADILVRPSLDTHDEWNTLLSLFADDPETQLPLEPLHPASTLLPQPYAGLQVCDSAEVNYSSDSSTAAGGNADMADVQMVARQQQQQHFYQQPSAQLQQQQQQGWGPAEAFTRAVEGAGHTAAAAAQSDPYLKPGLPAGSNSSSTTFAKPAAWASTAAGMHACFATPDINSPVLVGMVAQHMEPVPAWGQQQQPQQQPQPWTQPLMPPQLPAASLQPPRLLPLNSCCPSEQQQLMPAVAAPSGHKLAQQQQQEQQQAGIIGSFSPHNTGGQQLPMLPAGRVGQSAPAPGQMAAWGMGAAGAPQFVPAGGGLLDCIRTPVQALAVIGSCLHALTDLELHLLQQPRNVSAVRAMLDWLHAAWHRQVQAGSGAVLYSAGPAALAAAVADAKSAPPVASEPGHLSLLVLDKVMTLAADVLAGGAANLEFQHGFLLDVLVQLQQGFSDVQDMLAAGQLGRCKDALHTFGLHAGLQRVVNQPCLGFVSP